MCLSFCSVVWSYDGMQQGVVQSVIVVGFINYTHHSKGTY